MEKKQVSELLSTQILSKSAVMSHNRVDIESEQGKLLKAMHSLRGCIPYLTQGRTLADELEEERKQGIKEYHQYLRDTLGDDEYHEYLLEQLGEEKYREFIKENL
jgi:hypothetical protein